MIENKIIKFFAQAISLVFHPLIIPTLACFVVFNSGFYVGLLPTKIVNAVYIVVFILTFVLPALIVPALYLQKLISNMIIDERRERILPMAIVLIMYVLSFYFMKRNGFPPILLSFFIGAIASLFVTMIISLKWKISLHTVGVGGLIALIVFLSITYRLELYVFLIISVLIAGFIGTARMIAGTHTPSQIYVGYLVGFANVFVGMLFL